MKAFIYNYANERFIVGNEKDIAVVSVTIVGDNEIVNLTDCSGNTEIYDASTYTTGYSVKPHHHKDRKGEYYWNGSYTIVNDPEKIKAWSGWKPKALKEFDIISNLRLKYFCNGGTYDDLAEKNGRRFVGANQKLGESEQVERTVVERYPVVKAGVYALYSGDKLVYIGESHNIYSRVGEHVREGIKEFDSFDVYETPNRKAMEKYLIGTFLPKYNVRRNDIDYLKANGMSFVDAIKAYEGRAINASSKLGSKVKRNVIPGVKRIKLCEFEH